MAKNCVKGVPCGASCCAKRDGAVSGSKKSSKNKGTWTGSRPTGTVAKNKLKTGHVVDTSGRPSFSQTKKAAAKAQAEKKLSSIANSQMKLDKTVRKPKTPIVPGSSNVKPTKEKQLKKDAVIKALREGTAEKQAKAWNKKKTSDTMASKLKNKRKK